MDSRLKMHREISLAYINLYDISMMPAADCLSDINIFAMTQHQETDCHAIKLCAQQTS